LARDWGPWVETCLELFGPARAMFESNFPVDKGQFSYVALWNAFKRLADPLSQSERDDLFWRTAARTYDFDRSLFRHDYGRKPS
jgi:predicted TIM-barrel fold metal-dependent hydrolase